MTGSREPSTTPRPSTAVPTARWLTSIAVLAVVQACTITEVDHQASGTHGVADGDGGASSSVDGGGDAQPPRAAESNGPSPSQLYSGYVTHKPPPLDALDAVSAHAEVTTFIAWASASRPSEREDGRAVLQAVTDGKPEISNALIAEAELARKNDQSRALVVLSLVGEVRTSVGEDYLISLTRMKLPTSGMVADGEIIERAALERIQMKAADGVAYRKTASGDAEIYRLVRETDSSAVRDEAVRAWLYNNPSGDRAALKRLLPSGAPLFDRPAHGPDEGTDPNRAYLFNQALGTYLTAHPELAPPDPPKPSTPDGVVATPSTIAPSSANPLSK